MNTKKIMFLGAALHQIPIIKRAKEMGHYVITCDYFPDNPGHKIADESYDVSTVDKEKVLELAKKLNIDAIIAYASDVSAPTVAYVCEELGLPGNPYISVDMLTNKGKYRDFLQQHGFNCPKAMAYINIDEAIEEIDSFKFPVMVKPVDSSGSKGITKLASKDNIYIAAKTAKSYSRTDGFIIEEFIEKKGYQVSGDAFSVDGKLVFWSFGNEYYYENTDIESFVPMGECWPTIWDDIHINKVLNELQKLITAAGMQTSAYNVEAIFDKNDNPYIMELGPRNGGSMIPDIIRYTTGVDMLDYTIKAALGEDCSSLKRIGEQGFYANYNIPSFATGKFERIEIEKEFEERHVLEICTSYNIGDEVKKFKNDSDAVGIVLMKFDNQEEMMKLIYQLPNLIKVKLL